MRNLTIWCVAFGLMALGCNSGPDFSFLEAYQTRCRFRFSSDQEEQQTVACADIVVPESYALNTGNVTLHVAVFRTEDKQTNTAHVRLIGGPGQRWNDVATLIDTEEMQRVGSDLIIVDQRGVGQSNPMLWCEALMIMPDEMNPDAVEEISDDVLLDCLQDLQQRGIDISNYNTVNMAEDLERIRQALGYAKLDLVGYSFGTRWALEYVRKYPDRVRAAVLDSLAPIETSLFQDNEAQEVEVFEKLFTLCQEDVECADTFGDLEQKFADLYDALNEDPVTIAGRVLDGVSMASFLKNTVMDVLPTLIPALIDNLYLHVTQEVEVSRIFDIFESTTEGKVDSAGIMLISQVTCSDNPAPTDEMINAQIENIRREFRDEAAAILTTFQDVCQLLPSSSNKNLNPVVDQTTPILALSGGLDARTPLIQAQETVSNLANAFHVVFPRLGHSVTTTDVSSCAPGIMHAFLKDPQSRPSIDCVEQTQLPIFTDLKELVAAIEENP